MALAVYSDVNNVSSTLPDIFLAAQKRNSENNAKYDTVRSRLWLTLAGEGVQPPPSPRLFEDSAKYALTDLAESWHSLVSIFHTYPENFSFGSGLVTEL